MKRKKLKTKQIVIYLYTIDWIEEKIIWKNREKNTTRERGREREIVRWTERRIKYNGQQIKTTKLFRLPKDSKNERSWKKNAHIVIVFIIIITTVVVAVAAVDGEINFYVIRKGNKSVYNKE